jgi:hypothetical protein
MNHEFNFDDSRGTMGQGNPPVEPLSVGSGRTRVELELKYQGRDFLLLVTGGKAHVGAVAVWDGRDQDSEVVVTELPGHREGPLACECAEILGRASGRTVAVVVGIHQDNASREEIAAIVANVRQGAGELAKTVEQDKRTSDD